MLSRKGWSITPKSAPPSSSSAPASDGAPCDLRWESLAHSAKNRMSRMSRAVRLDNEPNTRRLEMN
jgi:hypothetical protein